MSSDHFKNYEYVAEQYAKETIINSDKEKYFLDGVRWAMRSIELTLARSGHPMADDSTNAMLKEWTLKDLKRVMKKMSEETK